MSAHGASVLLAAAALAAPAALLPGSDYRSGATIVDPPDAPAAFDITRATLEQVGRDLAFDVRVRGAWSRGRLCFYLVPAAAASATERLCLARATNGVVSLVRERLDATGAVTSSRALLSSLRLGARTEVSGRVRQASTGLAPGEYRWNARSRKDATAFSTIRLQPVRLRGCLRRGPGYVTGARTGRLVALTFDDGPAAATPQILTLLERLRVPATFFVVGDEVPGNETLLRRMLRDGDELGNHSYSHVVLAGGGAEAAHQLADASTAILGATGVLPCVFRPPYDASSPALVRMALGFGMSTVTWNVDPADWARPGTKAIIRRVTRAVQPGSIVLLHDGGGPRGQTVAAVEPIVRRLRQRGYRLVTVAQLLGYPEVWR